MVFIDKMYFYYKKIDNGKVTQPESGKNELSFQFINTHSTDICFKINRELRCKIWLV